MRGDAKLIFGFVYHPGKQIYQAVKDIGLQLRRDDVFGNRPHEWELNAIDMDCITQEKTWGLLSKRDELRIERRSNFGKV